MRLQYAANVRIVEMPCSGTIDHRVILHAFEDGADGVFVAGCLEGDCHFLQGNIRGKKRVQNVKQILDEVGFGGERVEFYNLSAAQGQRFAEIVKEMTERITKLGPNPLTNPAGKEGGAA